MFPYVSDVQMKWIYKMVRVLGVPRTQIAGQFQLQAQQVDEIVQFAEDQLGLERTTHSPEAAAVQALETHIRRLETFYELTMQACMASQFPPAGSDEQSPAEPAPKKLEQYFALAENLSRAVVHAHEQLALMPELWRKMAGAETCARIKSRLEETLAAYSAPDAATGPDDEDEVAESQEVEPAVTGEHGSAPQPPQPSPSYAATAELRESSRDPAPLAARPAPRGPDRESPAQQQQPRPLSSSRQKALARRQRWRDRVKREKLLMMQT